MEVILMIGIIKMVTVIMEAVAVVVAVVVVGITLGLIIMETGKMIMMECLYIFQIFQQTYLINL